MDKRDLSREQTARRLPILGERKIINRKVVTMVATQFALWSWFPLTLASIAEFQSSSPTDPFGLSTLIVPGSAAAAVIVCVRMFLRRMKDAGDEHRASIETITTAHERAMEAQNKTLEAISNTFGNRLDSNTATLRFLADNVIKLSSTVVNGGTGSSGSGAQGQSPRQV